VWPKKNTTTQEMSFYSQGLNTHRIPMSTYAKNRQKILARFAALGSTLPHSAILLQGGVATCRDDTDTDIVFRQESFFHYLFGVMESDCFGAILLETKKNRPLYSPVTKLIFNMEWKDRNPGLFQKKV